MYSKIVFEAKCCHVTIFRFKNKSPLFYAPEQFIRFSTKAANFQVKTCKNLETLTITGKRDKKNENVPIKK